MPPRYLPAPRPPSNAEKEREMFEALQRAQILANELGMKYDIKFVGNGKELTFKSE